MLKTRDELDKHFENVIVKYVDDPQTMRQIADYCYENFALPRARTMTILNLNVSIRECSESEIFWILVAMNNCSERWNLKISQFFTDTEINVYLGSKNNNNPIEFPIRLPMIQIADDQWIGKITAKELIRLRRADMITYNKSAQRRAKTIVKGDKEFTRLNVMVSVVNKIADLLVKHRFISNAITLNIPDGMADFHYDSKNKELIINNLKSFDIIDGFHRYVAMCNVADEDANFDYPMELRIVAFSDEKANNFIWQEEQKTRMSVVDAKSYNMNDLANKIANRIAESSICALSEIIDRNGRIPVSHLAYAIDGIWIKNISEEAKKTAIVDVTKEIIEDFNILTDHDSSLLTANWKVSDIYICINVFYQMRGKDKTRLYDNYILVKNSIKENPIEKKFMLNGTIKKQMQIVEAIMENNNV